MNCKSRNLVSLFLIVSILWSNSLAAAPNSTFNITAEVAAPISITAATTDLRFGAFLPNATLTGTIVLDPQTGGLTPGGAGAPTLLTGATVSPAEFTISGANDSLYTVTINTDFSAATLVSGANNMTVDAWRIFSTGKASVEDPHAGGGVAQTNVAKMAAAGNTDTLKVGGTLNIAAAQAAGSYVVNNIPIVVTYE